LIKRRISDPSGAIVSGSSRTRAAGIATQRRASCFELLDATNLLLLMLLVAPRSSVQRRLSLRGLSWPAPAAAWCAICKADQNLTVFVDHSAGAYFCLVRPLQG
jgi:hypothetical protein